MKFKAKPRPKPASSCIPSPLDLPQPAVQFPDPPRRLRLRQSDGDLSNYRAPSRLTAPDLDRRSPEFRVAHVRFFRRLKEDKFPMLDKTAYFNANESYLGVKIRRFHQWFSSYESDLEQIEAKKKPKPEKRRHQNKVTTQGDRQHWKASQKMDFINDFEREKAETLPSPRKHSVLSGSFWKNRRFQNVSSWPAGSASWTFAQANSRKREEAISNSIQKIATMSIGSEQAYNTVRLYIRWQYNRNLV